LTDVAFGGCSRFCFRWLLASWPSAELCEMCFLWYLKMISRPDTKQTCLGMDVEMELMQTRWLGRKISE